LLPSAGAAPSEAGIAGPFCLLGFAKDTAASEWSGSRRQLWTGSRAARKIFSLPQAIAESSVGEVAEASGGQMSLWPKEWASNFATVETGVMLEGLRFPTVEHGFQAAKTLSDIDRRMIQQQQTPGKTKRAGRKLALRNDWREIRERIMLDLLRQKFNLAPFRESNFLKRQVRNWLKKILGTTPIGRCSCPRHKGRGLNGLGILLMQVRDELTSA
jgi:hypothetical protein